MITIDYGKFMKSIEESAKDKTSAEKRGEWIPCSKRLPKEDVEVLVCTTSEEIQVAYYTNEWGDMVWTTGDFGSGTLDVIAWMPLPEPYKAK